VIIALLFHIFALKVANFAIENPTVLSLLSYEDIIYQEWRTILRKEAKRNASSHAYFAFRTLHVHISMILLKNTAQNACYVRGILENQ